MKLSVRESEFNSVLAIIENAKQKAYTAVNHEYIDMCWRVGEYVSGRVKSAGWGKGVVRELADFLHMKTMGGQGYSASNIWRMKQFYETYAGKPKLATVLRELDWTNDARRNIAYFA